MMDIELIATVWLAQGGSQYIPPAPYDWWWTWWVWVGGFCILILILFLIGYGVRGHGHGSDVPPTDTITGIPHETPLEALQHQYEQGEITREEYEREKQALER
jgi:uncharacterized membrane protein